MQITNFYQILMQRIFWIDFSKNYVISNFMEALPLGAEWFRADGPTDGHDEANNPFDWEPSGSVRMDGRTDMTKLIIPSQFWERA